ncbi:hypothetical protein IGI04_028429 [Brassica rapa subsp. trilocularis]|uniref:Uncharacterized protein n=1 Tax=Brassica rapa subsp. trilocularis TaxID=1813537 RepID=A0ABQ7L1X8_BRACM|nr:hypothetical protein IGI04_028429 [Brassica rapa subsp. trilocularis]
MEVPMINRIRDFEVGINTINDPSFLSRSVAVSGIGKLHQAYGFWKWGALIIAFLAYFTNFITRLKSLVVSFGDLFSWPDLGGIGSSGVVKLWDHLDVDGGDEDGDGENVVASFLRNCSSSASPSSFFLTAEKKGSDAVKVEACDPRAGFRMPALLAEWRQPGRFLGNIVGVDVGGVEKIYVRDDVSGKIAVGDLRRFNGALTDLTESDGETWWDADVVIGG